MATSDTINLRCFKAVWNGVNDKGHLPERLKLFNWGVNKTNQGDFLVDEGTLECFSANQNRLARQTIAVDFNHNTVEGTDAYKAACGSPEIAGYGVPIVVKGEGIFLEGISTTPSGAKKAGDYLDLSPSPMVDEASGRVLALHSVALTPTGSTEGLTLESAAQKALSATLKTLSMPTASLATSNQSNTPNAYKLANDTIYKSMNEEHMKMLQDFMASPSQEGYDAICAKLKPMFSMKGGKQGPLNSPIAGTEIITNPLSADDVKALLAGELKTLTASITDLKGQLDGEKAKLDEQERARIIAQASTEGKVIPLSADTIKTLTTPALRELCAGLKPNVVSMSARVRTLDAGAKPEKKTRADAAAAIEASIRSQYGESMLRN